MKKALLVVCLFLSLFGNAIPMQGQDTLAQAKKEILSIEPLTCNAETYSKFKKQKFYDYYHAKIKEKSFLDILYEKLNWWLSLFFQKTIDRKGFNVLMWIVAVVFVIVIGIILYIRKPGIFYINKKNPLSYSIEDENIAVEDLDSLTEKAAKENRFSDAIRWQYLKTLKVLHEQNSISYAANKTANEYVYEIKDINLRKQFRSLSGEFVYYRYGKGEADAGRFYQFRTAAQTIQKMRTG